MKRKTVLLVGLVAWSIHAEPEQKSPTSAPAVDRVRFPESYAEKFQVLRVVNKPQEHKVVTVYGNPAAASVTNALQLPYPYGSILVMETAKLLEEADGKAQLDAGGKLQKDKVTGLHVMRREKDFGEAYGKNRAGEWEFVEYKPDGSYLTPPQKSAVCAECHVKATSVRDFVYRGRFPEDPK